MLVFLLFSFCFFLSAILFGFLCVFGGYSSFIIINGAEVGYEISFYLDQLGLCFACVVSIISCSVCIFSSFYMSEEKFNGRFIWLILLFVSSILILLASGNMVTLIVGWDGLGLVSFILVIYYESKSSIAAGIITLIINRVGDVLFIIVVGIISGMGVWPMIGSIDIGLGVLLSTLILIGSITNSAQIPFSSWLPAAIAAPTPVSTLVHSSTLVTAGLFVLVRFSSGLGLMLISSVLGLLGFFTCLMAGSCAMFEPDLKKIVALSTLSQLGVIGIALSAGLSSLAYFHLIVHALFNALIFLCVGCIIIVGFGVQEARFFSGLVYNIPVTSMWLSVSCASLSGFPMFAGFFSKDIVMEGVMSEGLSYVGLLLIGLTCFLTGYYSLRLLSGVFNGDGGVSINYSSEGSGHIACITTLGLGSVVGAIILQSVILDLNGVIIVSVFENMSILSWVLAGFFLYLIKPVGNISGAFIIESFIGKMFYLSLISGSPVSTPVIQFSLNVSELESSIDIFSGSGFGLGLSRVSGFTSPNNDHWGVWVFLFFYMVFIFSLIIILLV